MHVGAQSSIDEMAVTTRIRLGSEDITGPNLHQITATKKSSDSSDRKFSEDYYELPRTPRNRINSADVLSRDLHEIQNRLKVT
jgi:hypothetical protein